MHHGQIRRNSNARVNIRSIALTALVGIAGCSSPGLIPGGRPLDRTALRVLAEDAAFRTGLSARLIRAVVSVESDGDPAAISRAGATGLMQLMPGTARAYRVVDPFDPSENVDGGSRYLRDLLVRYHNNLSLALAAYNAGPGAVDAAHGIPRFAETRAYVSRVLTTLHHQ